MYVKDIDHEENCRCKLHPDYNIENISQTGSQGKGPREVRILTKDEIDTKKKKMNAEGKKVQ